MVAGMKINPIGTYWAIRSQVAEAKLICRSMRYVDKNIEAVSAAQPKAIK